MKKQLIKKILPMAIATAVFSTGVEASNWLMLQGTEKSSQAPRAKLWGFIEASYQQTDDTQLTKGPSAGKSAAFNQVGPQLTSSSSFNVRRARIGIRGNNMPIDSKVNYFLLAEFGNNGITTGKNGSQGQLTDASITLNHIKGMRIRTGLFKTPGSEEGLEAIGVHNYINFTNVTNRLLLERHFDNATGDTGRNGPVGAFRDVGIQLFDSFNIGGWDTSYAFMYGNGNGLNRIDNDKHKDTYLYFSTEKVMNNTAGPRRHGLKFFAWNQSGKRTLADVGEKDRTRTGLGTTYKSAKYRLAAEYVTADGMIFGGTSGAGLPADGSTFSVLTDQQADGYYLDLGYRVIPKLELNVRYDKLNSGTKSDAKSGTNGDLKREFTTTTLGAQYFLNKKTVLTLNYELREITAPNAPSAAPVHDILKAIDNRLSAQVRVVF